LETVANHDQIWLNLHVDDRQFGYTTQLENENPGAPGFIDLRQLQGNWNSYTKKSLNVRIASRICDAVDPRQVKIREPIYTSRKSTIQQKAQTRRTEIK